MFSSGEMDSSVTMDYDLLGVIIAMLTRTFPKILAVLGHLLGANMINLGVIVTRSCVWSYDHLVVKQKGLLCLIDNQPDEGQDGEVDHCDLFAYEYRQFELN